MTASLISDEYRDLNAEMHQDPAFGAGAHAHAPLVLKLCRDNGYQSVLDYGCGKGTLKQALVKDSLGLAVEEYDPAVKGKDGDPQAVDLVVSLDVFEHIEPDLLIQVLEHISGKANKALLAFISLQEARRTLPDGRNAHLIVEDDSWWVETLTPYFAPVFARVLEDETPHGLARHLLFVGRSVNRPGAAA